MQGFYKISREALQATIVQEDFQKNSCEVLHATVVKDLDKTSFEVLQATVVQESYRSLPEIAAKPKGALR